MSKQRSVDTCFWDDSYIAKLDPSEKLLFMYLLTNPLTTICGVYEISMRRIAFDTGFEADTVKRILDRFERDDRCIYRDGWLAMRNWIKHQKTSAPGVREGIRVQLEKVPEGLAKYVSCPQSYPQGSNLVEPPSDPHLNLIKSNLIKSNLNPMQSEGGAAGPLSRPAAPTKEQRIKDKRRLLAKQAKQLGVKP